MDRAFSALGRFAVRFRWLVVMAWTGAAIAAGVLLPSLSSVPQASTSGFLPANAPSQQAARLASPLQGGADVTQVTVVAARAGTGLTAADQAAISSLDRALGAVAGVTSVRVTARSPGGQAEEISVSAQVGQELGAKSQADQELVAGLRAAIGRTALPGGLRVHLAGAVAASVDSSDASGNTGGELTAAALAFVVVLLVFVFGSLLAPLVTVIPPLLAVKVASPLIAEAAEHGLQVSQIAQELLAVLVIGAGADYGLFLIFRTREELRAGVPARDAVVRAVTRAGESISFSAGTVIAALLSLLAASFSVYSGLGVPLAIGIGLTLLAGLTLLPALLAIFGRATFWPVRPGTRAGAGWWGRTATRIVRRPAAALIIGLAAFGVLATGSFAYRPAGLSGTDTAPAGSDSATGNALLAAYFPQAATNPTGIAFRLARPAWDDPQALETLGARLSVGPLFTKVTGPLNPDGTAITPAEFKSLDAVLGPPRSLPATQAADPAAGGVAPLAYQAYQASGQYVSPDGRTIEYATTLAAGDPSTTAAAQAVPAVRAVTQRAADAAGATASGVTGQAAEAADVSSLSDSDLRTIIPIAAAVIAVLLALVMRSLIAPLYLIASVVVSYFGTLGLTVLLFMKLGGESGLTYILPFLMFIFMLALGEDYNILVMTRIREEARHLPLRAAVSRAIAVTGTTVTSAGIILAGTFAVVAVVGGTSPGGSEAIQVGAGLATGILMDTFVVRTLLVPSAVVLLGRWNWWPSRATAAAGPPHPSQHHPTLT